MRLSNAAASSAATFGAAASRAGVAVSARPAAPPRALPVHCSPRRLRPARAHDLGHRRGRLAAEMRDVRLTRPRPSATGAASKAQLRRGALSGTPADLAVRAALMRA
jgi:hypothetical protein